MSFVVEKLKAVFNPNGNHYLHGKHDPLLLAEIGQVLEDHRLSIGFMINGEHFVLNEQDPKPIVSRLDGSQNFVGPSCRQCPICGEANITHQENSACCTSCQYSKCS